MQRVVYIRNPPPSLWFTLIDCRRWHQDGSETGRESPRNTEGQLMANTGLCLSTGVFSYGMKGTPGDGFSTNYQENVL